MSDIQISDQPALEYYQIDVNGARAGLAAYEIDGDVIAFTHTEIDDAHGGQGLGSRLIRHALDDARARGLKVRPICPFVKTWIRRHEDYQDLLV